MGRPRNETADGRYGLRARGLTAASADGTRWLCRWTITDNLTGERITEQRTFDADGYDKALEARNAVRDDLMASLEQGYFEPAQGGLLWALGDLLSSPHETLDDLAADERVCSLAVSAVVGTELGRRPWRLWGDADTAALVAKIRDLGAGEVDAARVESVVRRAVNANSARILSLANAREGSVVGPFAERNGLAALGVAMDAEAGTEPRWAAYAWVVLLSGMAVNRVRALRCEDVDFATRTFTSRYKASPTSTSHKTHYRPEEVPPMVVPWPASLEPVLRWAVAMRRDAEPGDWLFPNDETCFDGVTDMQRWLYDAELASLGPQDPSVPAAPRGAFKCLRDLFARTMAAGGFSRNRVSETVGFIEKGADYPLGPTVYTTLAEAADALMPAPDPKVWDALPANLPKIL